MSVQTIIYKMVCFFNDTLIFPNWEDPDNSEGCCISFKIPGKTIKEEFCKILLHCITEDILIDPDVIMKN